MPPQEGRAGGLPTRPCQYQDVRKKQRQTWDDNEGWERWRGEWWSPSEVRAYNEACLLYTSDAADDM
eukprot:4193452-Alexandrium_andersonii.AAC.1